MRESKFDKYILIFTLFIFLYSFFGIGFKPIYESDLQYLERPIWLSGKGRDDVVVAVEYPSSVIICPLIIILFLCLIVFKEELRPVDRHWVKRKIKRQYQRFCQKQRNKE